MKAITPLLLLCLHNCVDLTSLGDLSVWTACLFAFFRMGCNQICFPYLWVCFKAYKYFSMEYVLISEGTMTMSLQNLCHGEKNSKERAGAHYTTLGHPLPIAGIYKLWHWVWDVPTSSPVIWQDDRDVLTHGLQIHSEHPFCNVEMTRRCMALIVCSEVEQIGPLVGTFSVGYRISQIHTRHTRRRPDAVQLLGDWKSDVYKTYLLHPLDITSTLG